MFSSSSLKNTCLLLYATFNPILTCTHDFWPQTCIHRDVCINPNIFGVFLHVCLKQLTLGLPYALIFLIFDSPLPLCSAIWGTPWIHWRRGNEEQRNYSPLLPQFAYTWVCIPLSLWCTLCSSQACLCLWSWYREMEDWDGGCLGGGLSFSGS